MAKPRHGDWSLYVVTDSRLIERRALMDIIAAAIRGGAKIIQYREKQASTKEMVEQAAALNKLCHRMGAYFLVNDRLDVALAVDADGVHVGQDDMPVALARKLLGPEKLLGATVHNPEEMRKAQSEGADHLSLAPVFATSTKPDHQTPLGIAGVRSLAAESHLPLVAIGGINLTNAADVIRAGVQGICVVSVIMTAADPEQAARKLYEAVIAARNC